MFEMSLKNRFRLIIFSMIALLVSIAIVAVIGIRHSSEHIRETIDLDGILVDLYELRILNSEYVSTPSERVKQQWLKKYGNIHNKLVNERNIPDDVKEALKGLEDIFGKLASIPVDSSPTQLRLRSQVASTMNIESQRVIDWASDISRQTIDRIVPHIMIIGATMLSIILVVAFATITMMLVTTRRVISSITGIKNGATEIAGGNLGFQISYIGNDEIASLAKAVNQMSCNLRMSYENLHEQTVQLETEMAERQLVNEQLQLKTAELVKEVEERQATQLSLEEQTVILKREVAERAKIQEEHDRLGELLLQSQKMEAVGLLAGGIAHDFNNILSVIMGYGDLLVAGLAAGRMQDNARQILRASERAADVTKGLLAFSRKQTFKLERTDINQLTTDNIKFLQRIIGEDIELVTQYHPTPLYIMLDRSQIQQVLMNLATNARDAMPSGGRLAICTAIETLDEEFIALKGYGSAGRHAVVRVSDNGSGMDSETALRIFEPFFTTKEQGHGTGLGLSIIHGIIAQHNGFVDCSSVIDQGTIFSIYLPLCGEREEPSARQDEIELELRGTETILLAEDDDMLLEITTNCLESSGYTVVQARDGAEAVALFEQHADDIDLVLLDAIMPKMTGKQAWNEISELRPGMKACFVSGYANEIISGKVAVDFNVPFISKPVMPRVLLQKVREILDARQ